MNNAETIYLKPNVIVEPLIARYRASPYLLQPATASMLLKKLVNRLLKSYIDAPQMHERAVSIPRLKGGPFLTLSNENVDLAKHLYEELMVKLELQFQCSEALERLSKSLVDENGASLERLLDVLPNDLAACIELTYDAWNRAHFSINEYMLYQSKYFDKSLQSFLIYEGDPDGKDFALTTPRIPGKHGFMIEMPFDNEDVQRFLASRYSGVSIQQAKYLINKIGISPQMSLQFLELFTDKNPTSNIKSTNDNINSVYYFGHACVLIKSNGKNVLLDPFISYSSLKDESRLSMVDLPEIIDAVVITHLHIDHFCIETLLNIKHKIKHVVIPSCAGYSLLDPSPFMVLKALGFEDIIELKNFQTFELDGEISIGALPFQGEHGELNISSKAMFSVTTEDTGYLFVADARFDNKPHLQQIARLNNKKIDNIFIGMESKGAPFTWLYGPMMASQTERSHDQGRRLNGSCSKRAYELVKEFQPSNVFVYALGREPWLAPIMAVEADGDTMIQDEITLFTELCHQQHTLVRVLSGTCQIKGEIYE